MDFDAIQVRGKSRSKSRKDIERAQALAQQIRDLSERGGPLKGLTPEQVMERLRQTREELWRETHAAGTR